LELNYNKSTLLPDGYIYVDYIENIKRPLAEGESPESGDTNVTNGTTSRCYINTKLIPNNFTGFKINSRESNSMGDGDDDFLLHTRNSAGNSFKPLVSQYGSSPTLEWSKKYTNWEIWDTNLPVDEREPWDAYGCRRLTTYINWKNDRKCFYINHQDSNMLKKEWVPGPSSTNKFINGELPEITVTYDYPLYIFAGNNKGTPYNHYCGKLWSLEISQLDEIVRQFVPVYNKNEGHYALYDKINEELYFSESDEDFTGPKVSTTYSLRNLAAEWGLMTHHGIRRLYHTPEDYEGTIEEYALENGFKRLIKTECPNAEGKIYHIKWKETNTEIISEWIESEPIEEVTE
jgi:hypothetical protein